VVECYLSFSHKKKITQTMDGKRSVGKRRMDGQQQMAAGHEDGERGGAALAIFMAQRQIELSRHLLVSSSGDIHDFWP
jgi:hypothetical protein